MYQKSVPDTLSAPGDEKIVRFSNPRSGKTCVTSQSEASPRARIYPQILLRRRFVEVQERLGGRDNPRLVPLLSCLIELLPWLKPWHNEVDPEFGVPMGDYFDGFIQEEARQLGKTIPEIKAWQPPQRSAQLSNLRYPLRLQEPQQ